MFGHLFVFRDVFVEHRFSWVGVHVHLQRGGAVAGGSYFLKAFLYSVDLSYELGS
jgi:hypothetical protein